MGQDDGSPSSQDPCRLQPVPRRYPFWTCSACGRVAGHEVGGSENYILAEITAFPGRSLTAKRAVYKAIVRNLGEVGIPASDILIVLHEPSMENWGIRGGQSADEVDLGFRLDV